MNIRQDQRLKQVRYLRHHLGWSQARIARKFRISQAALSQWLARARKRELQNLSGAERGPKRRWISPVPLSSVGEV